MTDVWGRGRSYPAPFLQTLARHGLQLLRAETSILQVNVGLLCNQACRHCHLEAGPDRTEVMDRATANEIVAYAGRAGFRVVDITGGAVELNPHIVPFIGELARVVPRIMLRSNLTALADGSREHLMQVCQEHRVAIVASFPAVHQAQTEAQRGKGVFKKSIEVLQRLNAMGYGQPDSGLELDLVSNPVGAFLPGSQKEVEARFRQLLARKWGIVFNKLFSFANVPLGRYRQWLERSGNLESYLAKLVNSFNPCAVDGLMCRTLVSVSWQGYLYDCDFNLARGIYLGGKRVHVSELQQPPPAGSPIAVSDHCYTCTAGSGFT
ncbi:MAG: arsenosugar biosynthesis radical SAM protein ArsS [Deltaproteobacteria bacterium]|nr:arsenosugar biosynthesis radical SAM protein ArsS [Deltaproteobacteria bacterium]MBW2069816.1 arsenosugar biosynthesis radical SAM protein ArsS [Deltaproteobacteria bacterium]